MFGKLMPEDGRFFDMFNQHAELCVKGAHELLALTTDFGNIDQHLHAIDQYEKQADTHHRYDNCDAAQVLHHTAGS